MRRQTGQENRSMAARLAFLAALLLLLAVLSLLLGSIRISPVQVIRAMMAGDRGNTDLRIFLYSRLPRTLGGILCGCGLAVAIRAPELESFPVRAVPIQGDAFRFEIQLAYLANRYLSPVVERFIQFARAFPWDAPGEE